MAAAIAAMTVALGIALVARSDALLYRDGGSISGIASLGIILIGIVGLALVDTVAAAVLTVSSSWMEARLPERVRAGLRRTLGGPSLLLIIMIAIVAIAAVGISLAV